jgi:tetratricopeptide (TPR) repeat protein
VKRTHRNLFIIMASTVVFYSIVTRLPWQAAMALLGAVLLTACALALWARDLFIARYQMRRRRWMAAIARYKTFERRLLYAPWRALSVVFYLGVYTFDGVAIVRNNIAQALIAAGELDQAVKFLRLALQRDPQYAAPYVNLGVIAAMCGDEQSARREMSKAVHLGYPPARAQEILRRALDKSA